MLTRHVSRQLAGYCDGQLTAGEARRIDEHLAVCERCRQERDDIRFAAGLVRQLTTVAAPVPLWDAIDAQLNATIDPKSFTFTPPKGVQVIDQTNGRGGR